MCISNTQKCPGITKKELEYKLCLFYLKMYSHTVSMLFTLIGILEKYFEIFFFKLD